MAPPPDGTRARRLVHRGRMPEETRDYVIKGFTAAVIGENPRLFGFDFDNPLAQHMEAAGAE